MPYRQQAQTLIPDIEGCIQVTVMDNTTFLARPASFSQRERGVHPAALMAGLAGGIPAVHRDNVPAIPRPLVHELLPDHPKGCIQNALGQLGSRETLGVQI